MAWSLRINFNTTNDINHSTVYYVPVGCNIAGQTIECLYDNGTTVTLVGRMIITAAIGNQKYSSRNNYLYWGLMACMGPRYATFTYSCLHKALILYVVLHSVFLNIDLAIQLIIT